MSDPTDYQGNSKKSKEAAPEKKLEKVVTGPVIVQKRTLGQKIKDTFIEADVKTVTRNVLADVIFPAFKNLVVDAGTEAIRRMVFGERAARVGRYGMGPKVTMYNDPINRNYRDPRTSPPGPAAGSRRRNRNEFILSSKDEANRVLEQMSNVVDVYQAVSVADLNELVGVPSNYTDQKWGWPDLRGVDVIQVHGGYLIDLPDPQAID